MQESPVPENYLVFAGESNQTEFSTGGRVLVLSLKGLEGEADSNQDGKISAGELPTLDSSGDSLRSPDSDDAG